MPDIKEGEFEHLGEKLVQEYKKVLDSHSCVSFYKHILPLIAALVIVTSAAGAVILYMARSEDKDAKKDIEAIQTWQHFFQKNLKEDVQEIKGDIKELKADVNTLTSRVNLNMISEPEFSKKIRMEARQVSREECEYYHRENHSKSSNAERSN